MSDGTEYGVAYKETEGSRLIIARLPSQESADEYAEELRVGEGFVFAEVAEIETPESDDSEPPPIPARDMKRWFDEFMVFVSCDESSTDAS